MISSFLMNFGTPFSCPARARTWTLLNQNQTCCQLHHGTIIWCLFVKDGAKIEFFFFSYLLPVFFC